MFAEHFCTRYLRQQKASHELFVFLSLSFWGWKIRQRALVDQNTETRALFSPPIALGCEAAACDVGSLQHFMTCCGSFLVFFFFLFDWMGVFGMQFIWNDHSVVACTTLKISYFAYFLL